MAPDRGNSRVLARKYSNPNASCFLAAVDTWLDARSILVNFVYLVPVKSFPGEGVLAQSL